MRGIAYARDIRVGACADYLLGAPVKVIEHRWGPSAALLSIWVRRAGFKLRHDDGHAKPHMLTRQGRNARSPQCQA